MPQEKEVKEFVERILKVDTFMRTAEFYDQRGNIYRKILPESCNRRADTYLCS